MRIVVHLVHAVNGALQHVSKFNPSESLFVSSAGEFGMTNLEFRLD